MHAYVHIYTHTHMCAHMHAYATICALMHTDAYIFTHAHDEIHRKPQGRKDLGTQRSTERLRDVEIQDAQIQRMT